MKKSALRTTGNWVPITKSEAKRRGLTVESLRPLYRACDLGLVRDQSIWFETPIAPRWIVAFRLTNQRGQPVIAELRVFPDEPGHYPPGRWSGEYGAPAKVPPGGLSARDLRQIRTQAFRADLRTIATHLMPEWGEELPSLFPGVPLSTVPPRATQGRKGRSDLELAQIAAVYEAACIANRPAIAAVAKAFKLSLSKARDAVRRARVRGLLSSASKQGKGGGLVTPAARAILKQYSMNTGGIRHAKR